MDDDLRTLLAKPAPSPEMTDHGRHRLQNAMRGPSSHRVRHVWLASGLGLTAAAAAVAVMVTLGTTATSPNRAPAAAKALTARQTLLAAAETAQRSPQPIGTYWHVKTEYTKWMGHPSTAEATIETWVRRDGRSWARTERSSTIMVNGGRDKGFYADGFEVGVNRLSYAQVQAMPTDQASLVKWLKPQASRERLPFEGALLGLLTSTPAPPKSRAAVLRILASLPGIKRLGDVKGGVGLLLSGTFGQDEVILDPATSQVRSATFSGSWHGQKVGGSEVVTAGWTDRLG